MRGAARDLAFEEAEVEHLFRAGIVAGKFPRWDPEAGNNPVRWEDVRSALLAMRIFTEEQVCLLAPWCGMPTIKASLTDMGRNGMIKLHRQDALRLPVWQVTERGVQDGVIAGVLSEEEAGYRTSIRRGQLLHDLAVGDGLILVGMELAREGAIILDVQTETAMLAKQREGVFPDFAVKAKKGGVEKDIKVEVVGVGANYRAKAKQAKVAAQGFRVFSPGFDGHGVRLG